MVRKTGRLWAAVFTISLLGLGALPAAYSSVRVAGGSSLVYTLQTPANAPLSVVTSTGKHLTLSISVQGPGAFSNSVVTAVTLVKGGANPETDTWQFSESQSDFTASSTGASIHVPKTQIGPYGFLGLTFAPRSSTAESCQTGSGTVYDGTITGGLRFYTNTTVWRKGKKYSGWGWIAEGGPKFSIGTVANPVTLTASDSCYPPTSTPNCFAGTSFSSPNYHFTGQSAQGSVTGVLTASARFALTVPKGSASITPVVTASIHALKFVPPNLHIAGSGSAALKGSALFVAGTTTPSQFSHPCLDGSLVKTQYISDYSLPPMDWTNGKTPLWASAQTGHSITQSNTRDGYGAIDLNTFS